MNSLNTEQLEDLMRIYLKESKKMDEVQKLVSLSSIFFTGYNVFFNNAKLTNFHDENISRRTH